MWCQCEMYREVLKGRLVEDGGFEIGSVYREGLCSHGGTEAVDDVKVAQNR